MSCETRRQPERIHDIATLQSRIVGQLIEAFREETLKTFFVAVDGLPGTGKSTVIRKLVPAFEELDGIGHFPVSVDDFIATDRESPLRRTMVETEDPEIFWRIFYMRKSLEYVLWKIALADGEALTVPISRKYDRPSGKVGPGVIKVPDGRKVVTMEGVNASEIMRDIFPEEGKWPFATVIVSVDPAIALLRAVERDVSAGRRGAADALNYRRKEYRHMIPRMEKNQARADFVFVNGHNARSAVSTVSVAPQIADRV